MTILHRSILLVICIAIVSASEDVKVESVTERTAGVDISNKEPVSPQESGLEPVAEKAAEVDVIEESTSTQESDLEPVVKSDAADDINPNEAAPSATNDDDCKTSIAQFQADVENCQSKISISDDTISKLSNELSETLQSLETCKEETSHASALAKTLKEETDALNESLEISKSDAKTCREEVATCLSDHNAALQDHATLQEKFDRIKGIHDKQSKELHAQIASLQSDVDKSKKTYKGLQEKYHDERDRAHDLEKELRQMHHAALHTYVNTTLMTEDMMMFLTKSIDKAIVLTEDIMDRKDVQDVKRVMVDNTSPALSLARELYKTHAAPHVKDLQGRLRDIDAVEGMRLFLISLVEQVGKTGLDYLELTESGRGHRGNSKIRTIMTQKLKYAKGNAEWIVDQSFVLCIMYVMYKVSKFFLVDLAFRLISGKRGAKADK